MEGIIERQRKPHEEIDRMEQMIAEELLHSSKKHRERLAQEHFVSFLVDKIQSESANLLCLYHDTSGSRATEIKSLQTSSELSEFYNKLRIVKEAHRNNPNELPSLIEEELNKERERRNENALEKMFSGEELFGKCVDLNELYGQYINLERVEKIDYMTYLDTLSHFENISKDMKKTDAFKLYLGHLEEYLESFFRRAKPLYNVASIKEEIMESFENSWKNGTIPGWQCLDNNRNESNGRMDDGVFFCIACGKDFTNQSVFHGHLKGKKHLKAMSSLSISPDILSDNDAIQEYRARRRKEKDETEKSVALKETIIRTYLKLLSSIVEETKSNIERKQSRTLTEREEDIEEEEQGDEAEETQLAEIENEKLYNPLKLPLGWDGKPIPYWLYKLHGLGKEYPCEICGNYVYMGRKAFDRHFQEWRHAHGMKCLGIPNTKHFQEITKIAEALILFDKLKKVNKQVIFKPDTMEEFEDLEGNVFNRKTFEDLHRQGLL